MRNAQFFCVFFFSFHDVNRHQWLLSVGKECARMRLCVIRSICHANNTETQSCHISLSLSICALWWATISFILRICRMSFDFWENCNIFTHRSTRSKCVFPSSLFAYFSLGTKYPHTLRANKLVHECIHTHWARTPTDKTKKKSQGHRTFKSRCGTPQHEPKPLAHSNNEKFSTEKSLRRATAAARCPSMRCYCVLVWKTTASECSMHQVHRFICTHHHHKL